MDELRDIEGRPRAAWIPTAAAVVAVIGIADSIYLTVTHFTGEPVPCNLVTGCEQVLSSAYAEFFGIPLAAFGTAAYFIAFSLAVLAAFGNRLMWTLFGVQAAIMAAFSLWLIYVQGFVIGAFCQFCLVSAASSLTLFTLFLVSKFVNRR